MCPDVCSNPHVPDRRKAMTLLRYLALCGLVLLFAAGTPRSAHADGTLNEAVQALARDRKTFMDGRGEFCEDRDKKTVGPAYPHRIVRAKSATLIRGWFITLERSEEFKVTEYGATFEKKYSLVERKTGALRSVISVRYTR